MKVESTTDDIIKIELTLDETKAILDSLGQTHCSGNSLTISMLLEDEIAVLYNKLKYTINE